MNLDDNLNMQDQFEQIRHLDDIDIFYDIKESLEVIKEIKKVLPEQSFLENYATMFSFIALYHLQDFSEFVDRHCKTKFEIEIALKLKEKE